MIEFYIFIYILILFGICTIGIFYLLGILIMAIILFFQNILFNQSDLKSLTEKINLDKIEEKYFKKLSKYEYFVKYIEFNIDNFNVNIKSWIFDRKKDKNIVFIHGVNSGSICWINLTNLFIEKFDTHNIYLMCLPGAGCSTISNIDLLIESSQDNIINFYSKCIDQYIKNLNLNNVTLIAHSLGSYFILNFILDIPNEKRKYNIDGILVLNPVSIISSVGYQGFYTVSMLKFGILNKFFNLFDIFSYNFVSSITKLINQNYSTNNNSENKDLFEEFLDYHLATLCSNKNKSYLIIDKFLDINGSEVYFNKPIIHKILNKFDVPLHIIISENDIIISKSYIDILKIFEESNCELVSVLKNKFHSPFSKSDSEELVQIINNFTNNNITGNQYGTNIMKLDRKKSYKIKETNEKYKSHYNYLFSYDETQNLLVELISILDK